MKYRITYTLVVVREIEAKNLEDADTNAWDFVPYPAVEGDVTSADCDRAQIEAICLDCGEGFDPEDEICDRCYRKQLRADAKVLATRPDPTCALCERGEEPGHEH
jgi:hypothetical protein